MIERASLAAPGGQTPPHRGDGARIVELDALRGLAAIVIVLHHFHPPVFRGWGFVAVNLFFVLSGFLISNIIIQEHARPGFYRVFFARRALRILPIYYLTLFGMLGQNALAGSPRPAAGLIPYLTFTQNIEGYHPGFIPPVGEPEWPMLEHLWTLACEEHFYLIWPPIICLMGPRWVIPSAVMLSTIAVVARGRCESLWILLTNMDGFALGAILAASLPMLRGRDRSSAMRRRILFGLVALTIASFPAWGRLLSLGFRQGMGYPMPGRAIYGLTLFCVNLGMFAIIGLTIASAGRPALVLLRGKTLRYLGTISYGLYVYHPIVFWALDGLRDRAGVGPDWAWGAAKFAVALGVASASWHWIELPILSFKRSFRYRDPVSTGPEHRPD